jgi:hypothetical protein
LGQKKKFQFKNKLMSFYPTLIELCASLFDWTKLRRTKGAVKLHLLLDHHAYLPEYAYISNERVHEFNFLKKLRFSPVAIVVIDRVELIMSSLTHGRGRMCIL